MFSKKKPLIISAIIVVLLAIASFFVYSRVTNQKGSETPTSAQDANMVTLSIKNGASAANSNYAVNGLHVYDPTTEDKENFVDGAEVKKGTKISIYVYNLASDVHLYIEHNGEVLADKDYPVLKSDEDVEFFELELKGDLKVVTKVANTKSAEKIAPIYINDDQLASLTVDGKEVATGSEITYGQHDFTVKALEKDITSTLKVSDKEVDTVTIKAGASHTYKKVSVDGTVFLHYSYANKEDTKAAKEEKAAKAKDESKPKPKGKEVEKNQDGYVVQVNNQTSEQLDIRYLDDQMNVHDIRSGSRYPKDLEVFSRVINKSSRALILSASLDGRVVDSTTIKPKPDNDDATYFGLESIKLTGNLVYTLAYADGNSRTKDKPATPKETPKDTPKTPDEKPHTPEQPNKPSIEPKKTATITIHDGAKQANTDYAVNGLHVYSPGYNDNRNFTSGSKVAIGTKLTIYQYNLASPTQLKVVHNGKVIADKKYDILRRDSDVDFIEFVVEGDVVVTSSVWRKTPSKPSPTPQPTPTPPAEETFKVTIDNPLPNVIVNASYVDMTEARPKSVKISSGQSVKKGTGIYVQLLNPTQDNLKLTAYIGNRVVGTTKLGPKPANEDYAAIGLMGDDYQGIPLTGNLRIVVEKVKEKEEYPVSLSGITTDAVDIHYGKTLWKTGEKIPAGRHTFTIQPKDGKNLEREVRISVNGKLIATKTIKGQTPIEFKDVLVDGKVELGFVDKEKMATITIKDGAKNANTNYAVNGLHVYSPGYQNNDNFKDGDQMPIGTKISVYEYNYASPVRIQIVLDGKTIVDQVQDYVSSDADVVFYDFELTGDVVITTTAVEPREDSPKLHIENPDLGFVYNADTYQEYGDQASLKKGATNFLIYSNQEPVDVTVSSKGIVLASQRLEGNKSFELSSIQVDADVTVSFQKVLQPTSYSLRISGDAADKISVTEGSLTYTNGSSISAGQHSLAIYNADYDETNYAILIKVNGQEVSRGTAFEYVSFDPTIDVVGDVEIIVTKQE